MANSAIRLRAMLDFESESGEKRIAGDEWLFEGPGTTYLRIFREGDSLNLFDRVPTEFNGILKNCIWYSASL